VEGDLEQLVNRTGLSLPLAAQILRVIGNSGASQLEITVALNLVGHLRHLLETSQVPA
jgi:hypothetical protein